MTSSDHSWESGVRSADGAQTSEQHHFSLNRNGAFWCVRLCPWTRFGPWFGMSLPTAAAVITPPLPPSARARLWTSAAAALPPAGGAHRARGAHSHRWCSKPSQSSTFLIIIIINNKNEGFHYRGAGGVLGGFRNRFLKLSRKKKTQLFLENSSTTNVPHHPFLFKIPRKYCFKFNFKQKKATFRNVFWNEAWSCGSCGAAETGVGTQPF